MSAYSELYVSDASRTLGEYFDYMVRHLGHDMDEAFSWLAFSRAGKCFGEGNPHFICGMTGIELAGNVVYEISRVWKETEDTSCAEKGCEYRVGSALAQYQWHSGYSFSALNRKGLTTSKISDMLVFCENSGEEFLVEMNRVIEGEDTDTNRLKRLRAYAGLTQKKLSEESGVALRMIQLYEQGQNDINKASAETVMKIADVLNCSINDVLR